MGLVAARRSAVADIDADPDSGQTTIVLIGFVLVTLLLVVTVLAITSVYVGSGSCSRSRTGP